MTKQYYVLLLLQFVRTDQAFVPSFLQTQPSIRDNNRRDVPAFTSAPHHFSRRPRPPYMDDIDDDYYESEEKFDTSNNAREYWERSEEPTESPSDYRSRLEQDVPEWEPCRTESDGTAWVLLPPPSVVQPTAVIHFVGGTFLGSSPQIWYRRLLEDIVRHTSAAVVATTIPLTLTKSPLNHVRLARSLQGQFEIAYNEVLIDEYGPLPTVPVCGIGHSLGARLLVVRATLGERPRRTPPPYKSFILMSFTNHRAASGIPGLAELSRKSRNLEQRNPSRRRIDDPEADDLLQSLAESVRTSTNWVQSILTPSSSSLEFFPAPGELWKAITDGQRYMIPQTLVVQFDDDPIDQSSQLSTSISGEVKFCRLRGTHLVPASSGTDDIDKTTTGNRGSPLERLLARATTSRANASALRELRQSIARYIREVVTKP